VLIEPAGRDTAPAVLAAALHLAATDPEGMMLVAPSDHVIPDTDQFNACVAAAIPAAQAGQLVTFGIAPDRPETVGPDHSGCFPKACPRIDHSRASRPR